MSAKGKQLRERERENIHRQVAELPLLLDDGRDCTVVPSSLVGLDCVPAIRVAASNPPPNEGCLPELVVIVSPDVMLTTDGFRLGGALEYGLPNPLPLPDPFGKYEDPTVGGLSNGPPLTPFAAVG